MTTKTDHFENQISISISPHPPCTPPPFKARHGIHFALLSQDRDKFGLVFLSISNHSELTFELTIRTSACARVHLVVAFPDYPNPAHGPLCIDILSWPFISLLQLLFTCLFAQ